MLHEEASLPYMYAVRLRRSKTSSASPHHPSGQRPRRHTGVDALVPEPPRRGCGPDRGGGAATARGRAGGRGPHRHWVRRPRSIPACCVYRLAHHATRRHATAALRYPQAAAHQPARSALCPAHSPTCTTRRRTTRRLTAATAIRRRTQPTVVQPAAARQLRSGGLASSLLSPV